MEGLYSIFLFVFLSLSLYICLFICRALAFITTRTSVMQRLRFYGYIYSHGLRQVMRGLRTPSIDEEALGGGKDGCVDLTVSLLSLVALLGEVE